MEQIIIKTKKQVTFNLEEKTGDQTRSPNRELYSNIKKLINYHHSDKENCESKETQAKISEKQEKCQLYISLGATVEESIEIARREHKDQIARIYKDGSLSEPQKNKDIARKVQSFVNYEKNAGRYLKKPGTKSKHYLASSAFLAPPQTPSPKKVGLPPKTPLRSARKLFPGAQNK